MNIGILAPYSRPWDSVDSEGSGQNVLIRESTEALGLQANVSLFRRRSRQTDEPMVCRGNIIEHTISAGPQTRLNRAEAYDACLNQFPVELIANIDVWLAHYWISMAWVNTIRAHSNRPILYFSHSFFGNEGRVSAVDSLHESAERYAVENCTWCANSTAEQKAVRGMFPRWNPELIAPGHTPTAYTPSASLHGRCLFVGRKNYAKGYDFFSELARRFPEYKFCAIGRNEMSEVELPNLENLSAISMSELVLEICQSDFVVCPSRYEHFGLVPLLAGYCETPVLATAVGGHIDTVVNQKTGWLCQPSVESLADTFATVISVNDRLLEIGRSAHAFVSENFTWNGFADQVISTIRRVE